jgi:hypothetical protein
MVLFSKILIVNVLNIRLNGLSKTGFLISGRIPLLNCKSYIHKVLFVSPNLVKNSNLSLVH